MNLRGTSIQSIAVNTRRKGLLKGEVPTTARKKKGRWRSSHKASLGVGFGGHQPRREFGTARLQGPGKEGCGEDGGETGRIIWDRSCGPKEQQCQ